MPPAQELYQLADELRAAASQGLNYANNEYDKYRYQQILEVSARLIAGVENVQFNQIVTHFENNLQQVSPRLAADAVVWRDNKILLIQRSDNGLWCLPGGGVDVGESLSQAALRELWEETGLRGNIRQFLGILDSRYWQSLSKVHIYNAMFLIEVDKESQPITTTESVVVGFFAENELPPLFSSHRTRVPLAFKQLRGEAAIPYVD